MHEIKQRKTQGTNIPNELLNVSNDAKTGELWASACPITD
jgi:hypothetical protein